MVFGSSSSSSFSGSIRRNPRNLVTMATTAALLAVAFLGQGTSVSALDEETIRAHNILHQKRHEEAIKANEMLHQKKMKEDEGTDLEFEEETIEAHQPKQKGQQEMHDEF